MKDIFFAVLWGTGAFAAGSILLYIGIVCIKELWEEIGGIWRGIRWMRK